MVQRRRRALSRTDDDNEPGVTFAALRVKRLMPHFHFFLRGKRRYYHNIQLYCYVDTSERAVQTCNRPERLNDVLGDRRRSNGV